MGTLVWTGSALTLAAEAQPTGEERDVVDTQQSFPRRDARDAQPKENQRNPATRATNFTFVEAQASISPRPFEGSDGVTNLVYELILTNFSSNPMKIDNIAITAAGSGKVLLNLPTANLVHVMTTPGVKKQEGTLAPGMVSLVFINIPLEKGVDVPNRLIHKITFTGKVIDKQQTKSTELELELDKTPPVVISAPLVGKNWLAAGGYSSASGHRRSLFPVSNQLKSAQRFAIDWVQLDKDNKLFTGTGKQNTDFCGYGKPVLAVADGIVYGVVNKFEDQPPFKASGSMEYPAGNSVTLKLGRRAFAMYAHLKPGSIKVKEGETVKKGQVIAEVGNVGNSDAPHLHLHITETPAILESNGVPYLFEQFDVTGAIELDTLMKNFNKSVSFQSVKTDQLGTHKNQLIKEGLLIDFGDARLKEDAQ